MTEIQDVTGTAFIVAEYRAQENAEQDPLYRDPIVPLFLSEQTRQAADRVAAFFPPGVQGVMLRTRYFDDRLDEQLSRGCRQVVIPGAGLDTRGVRKQMRHWWTSARKPSRLVHPPTLFSPAPSCAGVCSNGFDSLNRQHRLQLRPRLDEVAQGITLKHLDEGIARAPRLCATHNTAKSRKGR